jgi:hypoxia up-regulated 1
MGAMDTEVQITRYSMFNISEKKSSPYIHILSEAWDRELGSQDLDVIIVNILAEKFNAMPERAGKTDVRENYRAVRRLFKDAVKIKEILSANKFASVKIPELLDYVTLKFNLERTEVEAAGEAYFARVKTPITSALEQAGLTMDDIDQVEILGGGVRTPKTLEHMELALGRKDLSTHLNGDEAMCFGSAFIASNSSSAYKVKHVFLTQNPKYDVHVKITALNEEDALSEDEQKLLGAEEDEIIKYTQEFRLFNTTDYIGKSKGLSLNYDKDMKIELFSAVGDGEKTLIDTFIIDNIAK